MIKKIITISMIIVILLPNFSFGKWEQPSLPMPETQEEVKELGEKTLQVREKELPGIIEKIWKEEVLPIWQKMWNWFKVNIWLKIHGWLKTEIDKRKQFLKEGFEGEKEEIREELKTEVPKVGKSLWEKLKELVK